MATKKELAQDSRDIGKFVLGSLQTQAEHILWLQEALRVAKREFKVAAGVLAQHEPDHKILVAGIWETAEGDLGVDMEQARKNLAKHIKTEAKKNGQKN